MKAGPRTKRYLDRSTVGPQSQAAAVYAADERKCITCFHHLCPPCRSFGNGQRTSFDYTTTRTRDETTDLGLLRRPGNKASVTAVWTPLNELTIAATLVHASSWIDVNRDTAVFIPRLNAPAYTVVNLAANYLVNKNVTVFARADNLFNEHYQNPVGFLRPSLGVYGGVRMNN
jgi:vitamin B12 transporter